MRREGSLCDCATPAARRQRLPHTGWSKQATAAQPLRAVPRYVGVPVVHQVPRITILSPQRERNSVTDNPVSQDLSLPGTKRRCYTWVSLLYLSTIRSCAARY